MDVAMKDQSEQSFHLTLEQQLATNFLFRVGYQGSLGRHLPVLMNLNRYDGDAYNPDLAVHRPNKLYTGFNYRANNVSSNYNALVTEFQKRFSNGLQFQFGYTYSKLLDFNSALFAGETTQGTYSQPYYYVTNSNFRNEYGPGAYDHTHSFKFNYVYELPFLKHHKGLVGQVLGGWQISGFYQGYSGHPLEVYSDRRRYAGDFLDANGVPENIGGDYNLDGVNNDHPIYVGSSNRYSGKSPADGIFSDNNLVGCGVPGGKSSAAAIAACNADFGVGTPNSEFVNPPGGAIRYGMGRNLFRGPWFHNIDIAISKTFPITERLRLQFRADAVNAFNHANFDCIDTNVNSNTFGRALCVAGGRGDDPYSSGTYGPTTGGSWSNGVARRFQFSAKLFF
jgi:hypothetical protein